ncbi:MAG: tRNA (adenosine(37)-N6)-threonylcarbamoyltransferase complex transferase subunit TsaD [Candidatus Saccharibacteria bacterium]|nr:tRNA (adenosine(37)-N6)-threonylcarbamoyltransferase complex transferase subunit TsaD [Candidatus Saccharibacteria bacterium]
MRILGIESSCDETAAAVVENGRRVLSNVVNTQIDIHAEYGGVIPEIAARSHIEVINPVINQALREARLTWDDIDAIAVTNAPGLVGSLLIGNLAARTLAVVKQKPIYGIHHILAHFYANFLSHDQIEFPVVSLTASGGHTQLMLFESPTQFRLLGQTQDDAVGEAFDKVAKIVGLGYPGGPKIQVAAVHGDPRRFKFTHPRLTNPYDFSFSGVKTAVLRQAQELIGKDYSFPSFEIAALLSEQDKLDLVASFQQTVVEILTEKTVAAFQQFSPRTVALAGGVSANTVLRTSFEQSFPTVITPEFQYCTDNAAMVASAGYFWSQTHQPNDPFKLSIHPNLSVEKII